MNYVLKLSQKFFHLETFAELGLNLCVIYFLYSFIFICKVLIWHKKYICISVYHKSISEKDLNESNFKVTLKFNKQESEKRSKRKIIWFNLKYKNLRILILVNSSYNLLKIPLKSITNSERSFITVASNLATVLLPI